VERLRDEAYVAENWIVKRKSSFDVTKAEAILHFWRDAELLKVVGQDRFHLRKQIEWRERRVQELEEALRDLLECSSCENGCDKDDMTCASRKAEKALARTDY
jgi:uncharacterized membrane-anchored protein YhcB (DUF1043 family)